MKLYYNETKSGVDVVDEMSELLQSLLSQNSGSQVAYGPHQGYLELSGWTASLQVEGDFLKSYSSHRYFFTLNAMR